jgi:hypothetical protein
MARMCRPPGRIKPVSYAALPRWARLFFAPTLQETSNPPAPAAHGTAATGSKFGRRWTQASPRRASIAPLRSEGPNRRVGVGRPVGNQGSADAARKSLRFARVSRVGPIRPRYRGPIAMQHCNVAGRDLISSPTLPAFYRVARAAARIHRACRRRSPISSRARAARAAGDPRASSIGNYRSCTELGSAPATYAGIPSSTSRTQ